MWFTLNLNKAKGVVNFIFFSKMEKGGGGLLQGLSSIRNIETTITETDGNVYLSKDIYKNVNLRTTLST